MPVRAAGPTDVDAIRAVSLATGQPPADSGADTDYVALVLATGRALVAVDADRVVGWGAARGHGAASFLTDLFVAPDRQGGGVGGEILRELWPPGGGEARFTFSSRHPNAVPLYRRAGLRPSWPLLYLAGPAGDGERSLQLSRVGATAAADAEARLSGLRRDEVYRFWTRTPGSTGLVIRDAGRLVACGAARPGSLLHLTCPDGALAARAVRVALAACGPHDTTVCLPRPHPAVAELLGDGFRLTDHDLLMATPGWAPATTWAYSPGLA